MKEGFFIDSVATQKIKITSVHIALSLSQTKISHLGCMLSEWFQHTHKVRKKGVSTLLFIFIMIKKDLKSYPNTY